MKKDDDLHARFESAVKQATRAQARTFAGIQRQFAARIQKLAKAEKASPAQAAALFASVRKQFEAQLGVVAQSQAETMQIFAETEKSLLSMIEDVGSVFASQPRDAGPGNDQESDDQELAEPETDEPETDEPEAGGSIVDQESHLLVRFLILDPGPPVTLYADTARGVFTLPFR